MTRQQTIRKALELIEALDELSVDHPEAFNPAREEGLTFYFIYLSLSDMRLALVREDMR